jgi:hypothetical protein
MPRTLYSTKDAFKKILAWGQNTVDKEIPHRVLTSLGLASKAGKGSVKAGDGVQADRVILVTRV